MRLDGAVDYETSDGEVRHVPAGGFVLVEDTHGNGHISSVARTAQNRTPAAEYPACYSPPIGSTRMRIRVDSITTTQPCSRSS
ncbi:MAG TPA: hypothetical protein VF113_15360, partial [Stellaceae bacterium]